MGHVMCLDRETGNFRWGLNMMKEYKTEVPDWYTGQCPLIDNDLAILAPGGTSLMVAINCETGQKVWETPNPGSYKMSHSSIMPFTFGGTRMFVYSAVGGAVGVAADGPNGGKILWETGAWKHDVISPAPVCMPDGRIFLSAGYGAGSMVLQLSGSGDRFDVKVTDEYLPAKGLASEQQTPLFWNGHLLGIMPKEGGIYRMQMVCVHPSDPKKVLWASSKEGRFGLGPYFIADNKLFILDDEAVLTIAKPSLEKYIQLDQAKITDGYDSWAPFALADGYLLLRDSKTMVCIDLNI
jgi:outer membrane protein assembly factor BamB